MNGVSLLVALATLGVSARVENGVNNIPTYTIRIDSFVLPKLLSGEQEIKSDVLPADRAVRRYKILVVPEKAYQPRAGEYLSQTDTLFESEALQTADGKIELWVQIAPDRIATLAAGKAIEGEVPIVAPEVDRYVIFVGAGELPRQKAAAAGQSPQTSPTALPGGDFRFSQTGADSSRTVAPPLRSSTGTAGQLNGSAANTASRNPTFGASLGSNLNLRNSFDSTGPPPLINNNYAGQQPNYGTSPPLTGPNSSNNRTDDNRFGVPNYSYNQYPQQQPNYNDRPNNGGIAATQATQTQWPAQFNNQNYGGLSPPPAQQNYGPRPDQQFNTQYAAAGNPPINYAGVQQPVAAAAPVTASPQPAAAAATASAAAPPAAAKLIEDERKSSTPLILTTLALFTSLGVNTYLGWLAYSFFWRYRDAVNDSVRARAYNVPGRQAA